MSNWTRVRGLIEVDVPGNSQAQIDYILQSTIDHLPKVTGSERNMEVYTVRTSGYNSIKNFDENYNWVPEDIKTQSCYFLVLDGSLRDRHYDETFKELNKFLVRLSKRIPVDYMKVELSELSRSYTFTNRNDYYSNMFEGSKIVQLEVIPFKLH